MRNKPFRPNALIGASKELDRIYKKIDDSLSKKPRRRGLKGWLLGLFGRKTNKRDQ